MLSVNAVFTANAISLSELRLIRWSYVDSLVLLGEPIISEHREWGGVTRSKATFQTVLLLAGDSV